MILAGDIGGTKCKLALYEPVYHGRPRRVAERRFAVRDWPSLADVLRDFLHAAGQPPLTAAGFGVAGPVINNQVRATNLPWFVDGTALAAGLGLARVVLLNDLEAMAHGLPLLEGDELFVLNQGAPDPTANQALIAAGTGLGEAIIHRRAGQFVVVPTEGGHTDFAPRTEEEIELLRFALRRFAQVSWEHVLAGRGFQLIHEFLAPAVRHASFTDPAADSAVEISSHARARACPACVHTHELWVTLFGREAGNLAMKSLARGGVYVGGGIAAKLLENLKDGRFLEAFCDKSNFRILLSRIPIYIVLNEDTAVLGAAGQAMSALAL
jgi:glucokinase